MELDNGKTPLSKIHWKDYMRTKFPDVPLMNLDKTNRLTDESILVLKEFSAAKVKSMCTVCKEKQMRDHGEIVIECNGLASKDTLINESIQHMFSEEELEQFEQIANPYAWAESTIDVEAIPSKRIFSSRWYQEQMVRCTAKRKSYRCGRRAGKTFSFALNILHRVLTNDNYKVLIVTPYEVQAEELVNQIRDFIYKLDPDFGTYKDMVVKDVKSPSYFMSFTNGSRIRGFTTGSSGAGSVRGQAAHLIVLDEVDYMSDDDFNSIIAILADNPDTELWVASSPDSNKTLYKLESIPSYKKFHFPSFVLPHYNDKLDKDFRNQLTEIGYVQEIMAEFGTSQMGVFQPYFIDKAKTKIVNQEKRDDVLVNRGRYLVILGCDWNDDKVGTRIMCVAFDKVMKKFFIAESLTISKDGWSQVEAVQTIINLNRKYEFEHIYVDEGFGVSQIQFIKQYALDQYGKLEDGHPDYNLANVVGINFSSKIEVMDVVTNEVSKKDAKTYMVENATRYLEREVYMLDEVYDKPLIDQMANYVIKGRSPTGKPTYIAEDEKIGDHDLDAFMLAILGFSMEYSQFLNIQGSDVLIHLVSRDIMIGEKEQDKFGDPFDYNPENLYANLNKQNRTQALYQKRINRYNRSTIVSKFGRGSLEDTLRNVPTVNSEGYLPSGGRSSRFKFGNGGGKGRASF